MANVEMTKRIEAAPVDHPLTTQRAETLHVVETSAAHLERCRVRSASMAKKTFVCPICGRETVEVARMVAQDPNAAQEASEQMPDAVISAPPFCETGHAPVAMQPA